MDGKRQEQHTEFSNVIPFPIQITQEQLLELFYDFQERDEDARAVLILFNTLADTARTIISKYESESLDEKDIQELAKITHLAKKTGLSYGIIS